MGRRLRRELDRADRPSHRRVHSERPRRQRACGRPMEAGFLWVANSLDSTVSKVDPTSGSVAATIPVGSGPSAIATAEGSVWVANQHSGSVSRIDPDHNAVAKTVSVGGGPTALTVADGRTGSGCPGARSAAWRHADAGCHTPRFDLDRSCASLTSICCRSRVRRASRGDGSRHLQPRLWGLGRNPASFRTRV